MKKAVVVGIIIAIIIVSGVFVYSQNDVLTDTPNIESQKDEKETGSNITIQLKESVGVSTVP